MSNSDAEVMYFSPTCVCLELMPPSEATNVAGLWASWEGRLLLRPRTQLLGDKCLTQRHQAEKPKDKRSYQRHLNNSGPQTGRPNRMDARCWHQDGVRVL